MTIEKMGGTISPLTLHSLILTAMLIGVIHTLLGPDHYLPFVALSRANQWSLKKTLWIAGGCGLAHCFSSVGIGLVGVFLGIIVGRLELVEAVRGQIASFLLIAFGLAYLVWAIKNLIKKRPRTSIHQKNLFWAVFIIFAFGPCEPLIPLLIYPAAKANLDATLWVVISFTAATVTTMLVTVAVGWGGLHCLRFRKLEPFAEVFASSTILACGFLMVMGL